MYFKLKIYNPPEKPQCCLRKLPRFLFFPVTSAHFNPDGLFNRDVPSGVPGVEP